jgi:hypothetical protein
MTKVALKKVFRFRIFSTHDESRVEPVSGAAPELRVLNIISVWRIPLEHEHIVH